MVTANNLSSSHRTGKLWARLCPTRSLISRCVLVTFFTIGLSACSDDVTVDLSQYVQEVKARQKSRIPPLPKPKEFRIFAYDDSTIRNPFVPTVVIEAPCQSEVDEGCVKPIKDRPQDVLEQYALGSLKMMGSLEKNGKRWALVRASDGTLYRTTVGKHLGKNNGRILKITESQIELKEIVPDGLGGWIERTSTLTASE